MIVVVGGGLAGLRAALTIQESGQQVALIESQESVGGRISSERIDGFTIDRGFQVINPGYREFESLDIRTHFHSIPAGAVASIAGTWNFYGDPRRELRSITLSLPSIATNLPPFLDCCARFSSHELSRERTQQGSCKGSESRERFMKV